jgi:hypothetical protein
MTMLTRSKNAFVLAALLSTASAPFTTQVFAADYGLGWARGNAMSIQQSTKEGAQAYAAEPTSRGYKANARRAEGQQPDAPLHWIDDPSTPGG